MSSESESDTMSFSEDEVKGDFNHMVVIQANNDFDFGIITSIDINERLTKNQLDIDKPMMRFADHERRRLVVYGFRLSK